MRGDLRILSMPPSNVRGEADDSGVGGVCCQFPFVFAALPQELNGTANGGVVVLLEPPAAEVLLLFDGLDEPGIELREANGAEKLGGSRLRGPHVIKQCGEEPVLHRVQAVSQAAQPDGKFADGQLGVEADPRQPP